MTKSVFVVITKRAISEGIVPVENKRIKEPELDLIEEDYESSDSLIVTNAESKSEWIMGSSFKKF